MFFSVYVMSKNEWKTIKIGCMFYVSDFLLRDEIVI